MSPAPRPDVTVIVPCFNAEQTIALTIESALAQDAAIEVIVVDDGSTDGSAEIIRSFGARVQAYFGPNRGVSAARNTAIEHARGDWIQFLDSDDLLCPGTVRQRLEAAGGAHDAVICDWLDFSVVDGKIVEGSPRGVDPATLASEPELAMARDMWAPPAAVLYRRELVRRIGGFRADLPVIQDARFLFDAAYHGARFVHLPQVGARYRIVQGSLSRRNPGRFWADVLLNGQQIEDLWRARGELSDKQVAVVRDIYLQAGLSFLSTRDSRYAEARAQLVRLGGLPLQLAIAEPLSRLVGYRAANRLASMVARS